MEWRSFDIKQNPEISLSFRTELPSISEPRHRNFSHLFDIADSIQDRLLKFGKLTDTNNIIKRKKHNQEDFYEEDEFIDDLLSNGGSLVVVESKFEDYFCFKGSVDDFTQDQRFLQRQHLLRAKNLVEFSPVTSEEKPLSDSEAAEDAGQHQPASLHGLDLQWEDTSRPEEKTDKILAGRKNYECLGKREIGLEELLMPTIYKNRFVHVNYQDFENSPCKTISLSDRYSHFFRRRAADDAADSPSDFEQLPEQNPIILRPELRSPQPASPPAETRPLEPLSIFKFEEKAPFKACCGPKPNPLDRDYSPELTCAFRKKNHQENTASTIAEDNPKQVQRDLTGLNLQERTSLIISKFDWLKDKQPAVKKQQNAPNTKNAVAKRKLENQATTLR